MQLYEITGGHSGLATNQRTAKSSSIIIAEIGSFLFKSHHTGGSVMNSRLARKWLISIFSLQKRALRILNLDRQPRPWSDKHALTDTGRNRPLITAQINHEHESFWYCSPTPCSVQRRSCVGVNSSKTLVQRSWKESTSSCERYSL